MSHKKSKESSKNEKCILVGEIVHDKRGKKHFSPIKKYKDLLDDLNLSQLDQYEEKVDHQLSLELNNTIIVDAYHRTEIGSNKINIINNKYSQKRPSIKLKANTLKIWNKCNTDLKIYGSKHQKFINGSTKMSDIVIKNNEFYLFNIIGDDIYSFKIN